MHDVVEQKIIAVCDHFGVEPCYYSHIHGQLIFGSTIPSVLNHMKNPRVINSAQMDQLFFNKWFTAETYSDET